MTLRSADYSYVGLAANNGQLLVTGTVTSSSAPSQCVAAPVDPATLAVGTPRTSSCPDPGWYGQPVVAVVSYISGSNNATISVARTNSQTGATIATGAVVMTFGDYSDSKPVIAYGGGSLWIYDVDTTVGPEAVQISERTGQVEGTVKTPKMSRPIAAANNEGLWLATSINNYPGPALLLNVKPGAHAAATVLPTSNTVVDWLLADDDHLWAGTRPPGPNYETLWRFDGARTHAALKVAEPGLFTSVVVGSGKDGLWTAESDRPFGDISARQALRVIRINPNTGQQAIEATLPVVTQLEALEGVQPGESAVSAGYFVLLETTNSGGVQLTRIGSLP